MATPLPFPGPPPPPFSRVTVDRAPDQVRALIEISIPPPRPTIPLDVVLVKDGQRKAYHLFEQPAQPGTWTSIATDDDKPPQVSRAMRLEKARELSFLLQIHVHYLQRAGWRVTRDA